MALKKQNFAEDIIIEIVSNALADKKGVGWMQGRIDFSFRSLGGRSIIADPRYPTDAFECFMSSEIDILGAGNYVLFKAQQDEAFGENYEECYELD